MAVIIRKSDVIKRLTEKRQNEIEASINKVNKALTACTSLPIVLDYLFDDVHSAVREEVLAKLRDAGWRIEKDLANLYILE